MTTKTYRTIVVDPPWEVERAGGFAWRAGSDSGERAVLDYPTLTVPEIKALPVGGFADRDAHLFMWCTQRYSESAFGTVREWGFKPSCTLVWCKRPHGWGPGGVFQRTVEFVVYARRGRPLPRSHTVDREWWVWQRGAHSAKPEAFLDMVEANFPGPYLEMFGRRARFNWDYTGDQSLETAVS